MAGRRRRHEDEEEHENHERWLVTYADMVTLLMVLFIVMFSMSQVDVRKFNALKSGLAAGFGQSTSVLQGSSSVLEETGTTTLTPIAPQQQFERLEQVALGRMGRSEAGRDATATATARAARTATPSERAAAEVDRLGRIAEQVASALRQQGLEQDVRFSYDERGLVLSLVSRHVVFRNDRADLSPRGERVVDALGPVLAGLREDVEVSGHTNQVKVVPRYFPTDWDLSAARALTVLRRLDEQLGLPAHRLSMSAHGGTRPLLDPARARSQEVNKRVDVVVLSPADPETRELLDEVSGTSPATPATSTGPTTGTTAAGTTGTRYDAAAPPTVPDQETAP